MQIIIIRQRHRINIKLRLVELYLVCLLFKESRRVFLLVLFCLIVKCFETFELNKKPKFKCIKSRCINFVFLWTTVNWIWALIWHLQDTRSKIVRPWDQFRGSVHAVRPFLPPALLHYEHRLALDYQRHLEHLNAQAQLLRHMNINMSMEIKSESGSERSSSAASDCCSPEIGSGSRLSDHHMHHSSSQQSQQSTQSHHSQKLTKPSDTPLDALFQMTNKNFDESQGLFTSILLLYSSLFIQLKFSTKLDFHFCIRNCWNHLHAILVWQDFCFCLHSDPIRSKWFSFMKKSNQMLLQNLPSEL